MLWQKENGIGSKRDDANADCGEIMGSASDLVEVAKIKGGTTNYHASLETSMMDILSLQRIKVVSLKLVEF